MASSPPIRVGTGYIEVTAKLELTEFKRELNTTMTTLGKSAAVALTKGVQQGMTGAMASVIGSVNRAGAAILKVSAENTKLQAAQLRSAASLAATEEHRQSRLESNAAKNRARISSDTAFEIRMANEAAAMRAKAEADYQAVVAKTTRDTVAGVKLIHELRVKYLAQEAAAQQADFDARLARVKATVDGDRFVHNMRTQFLAQERATEQAAQDARLARVRATLAGDQAVHDMRMRHLAQEHAAALREDSQRNARAAMYRGLFNQIAADEARAAAASAAADRARISRLKGMATAFRETGHIMTTYVTTPLLAMGGYAAYVGIKFADLKNRTIASMSAFVGSETAAKKYVAQIEQLATRSPLAAEKLLDMARALSQTKFGAANLMPMMTGLNNLFAAHHMTTQQASNAQLAFTQMLQKGRIQSEEMTRQLSNAGVNGWELFSAATGKSVQDLQAASKAGTLLTNDVFPKLFDYLNKDPKYAEASERAINNLSGAWTRLQNVFKVGLATEKNDSSVKGLAKSINQLADSVQDNMGNIQDFVSAVIATFKTMIQIVGTVGNVFTAMPSGLQKGLTALLAVTALLGPTFLIAEKAIKVFLFTTGILVPAVRGAVASIGTLVTITRVSIAEVGLLGTAMRAAGAAVGAFAGPVGWAVLAIGAAVGALALWTGHSQKAKEAQQALTEAVKADSGVLAKNTNEALGNILLKDGTLQRLKRLNIDSKQYISVLMGEKSAQEQLAKSIQSRIAFEERAAVSAALAAKARQVTPGGRNQQQEINDLKAVLRSLQDNSSALNKQVAEYKLLADATGGDTVALGNNSRALQINTTELQKNYDEKLAEVNASLGYRSSLYSMSDAIQNNSHSLALNTRDGVSNRQAVIGVVDGILKEAAALEQAKTPHEQIAATMARHRDEMINFAVASGASRVEVTRFIDQLLQIPHEWSTTLKVNVVPMLSPTAAGINALIDPKTGAARSASEVQKYIDKMNGYKSPESFKLPKYTPPTWSPSDSAVKQQAADAKRAASQRAADAKRAAAQRKAEAKRAAAERLAEAKRRAAEAARQAAEWRKTGSSLIKSYIEGLSQEAPALKDSLDQWLTSLRDQFAEAGKSLPKSLLSSLGKANAQIIKLAKERDAVLEKIAAAQDLSKSVTAAAKGSASLTNLPYSTENAYGIKYGLQERLTKIKAFVDVIKKLTAKGLSKSLLQQVIDAGPIDGTALGQTLLAADKTTFKAINDAQAQIDKQSKTLGDMAANAIYGSVAAMQKKGKELQTQMNNIAKAAMDKVGKVFGIGWNSIQTITNAGMGKVNDALRTKLGATATAITSTTSTAKSAWSGMVDSMNASTAKMVNVSYGEGVRPTIGAMADLAGQKNPLKPLKFSKGGPVPGPYEDGRDSVFAYLSKGEYVFTPNAVKNAGGPEAMDALHRSLRANAKPFAKGGYVNGGEWVRKHKDDPFAGYDSALSAALKAVVDPTLATLSKMSGGIGKAESGDMKASYGWLHSWAKKLDKASAGSAGKVLSVAKSQLGVQEVPGGSNNVKYNNFNGEQWCADFVSWVVDKAHANKSYWNSPTGTPDSRWPAVQQWKNAAGKTLPASQARAGDLAYYRGDGHINIVQKSMGGGKVFAIGGNQSNAVTQGIFQPDGVIRPNLSANGGSNPWPGSSGGSGYGGSLGGGSYAGGGTPAKNRALGQRMNADMGWGSQWSSLDHLWQRESSWNHLARNPSSGAYGIPQSLPADKMASAGKDWRTNPVTQMRWGLGYIRSRYSSPSKAWAHSQGLGWYEDGAWEIKRDQMAMVHRGEMVVPKTPAKAIRKAVSSGNSGKSVTYDITINAAPDVPTEQTLLKTLSYAHTMYGN